MSCDMINKYSFRLIDNQQIEREIDHLVPFVEEVVSPKL